jgi:hypothetical protein
VAMRWFGIREFTERSRTLECHPVRAGSSVLPASFGKFELAAKRLSRGDHQGLSDPLP